MDRSTARRGGCCVQRLVRCSGCYVIGCSLKAVDQFSSATMSDYTPFIHTWWHSDDGSNVIHQLSSIPVKLLKLRFSKRRDGLFARFYAMRFVIKVRDKLLSWVGEVVCSCFDV